MRFDDDLSERIREVNDDCPVRQGMRVCLLRKKLQARPRNYMANSRVRCDFICAYDGEELIGFLHLVYRGGNRVIFNLTMMPSHFDKRPTNRLSAQAVQSCEAKGISNHLRSYNYGNKRDSPLREFKIRCGSEDILVPRYFVPLTRGDRFG